jgi:hypothetical protein
MRPIEHGHKPQPNQARRRQAEILSKYVTKTNAVGILHRSVFVKTLPLRGRVSI